MRSPPLFVKGFTTNPTLFLRALGGAYLPSSDYVSTALDLLDFAAGSAAVRDFMIQGVGAPEQILTQASTYRNALRDERKNLWIKLLLRVATAARPAMASRTMAPAIPPWERVTCCPH